jgi:hypothetical protein
MMSTESRERSNTSRWLKRAGAGLLALGMFGISACAGGYSHRDRYYYDGAYYYGDSHAHRHYDRYDRDGDGYRDRGYYDRNGYWHRY